MPSGTWDQAYSTPYVPGWGAVINFGELVLTASRSTIEPDGAARVTAWSGDMSLLGKVATLYVDNPDVATSAVLTAVMQPNAVDGVEAIFLVYGLVEGESTMYVEVPDGP